MVDALHGALCGVAHAAEQEQAAALFNTRLRGLHDARDREKALKDIVISIRRSAAERERRQIEEGLQEPTAEMLTGIMTARKELQALQKISFKLGDAEDPQ